MRGAILMHYLIDPNDRNETLHHTKYRMLYHEECRENPEQIGKKTLVQ
jgi:hypothetical protein